MGSDVTPPDWADSGDEETDTAAKLGKLLSGRLADVDIDSVEAVRDVRERRHSSSVGSSGTRSTSTSS